ncbi:3-hydroxyisobutyrate dehydrogenase-like beta-hydroxyacid dehydrogenase [Bradyrhizobium sp. LM6.11]
MSSSPCYLPDTPHVEATIYGEHGLLKSPPSGKLIVDMSTISPVAVRRIHADLQKAGVSFIDAPVSGGPLGARNAALSIMAGGDAEAFAKAEPFFRAMGTTITHVGAAGAGQTVKLCNQLICGINIQAICEALALGRASGLDLDLLRRVLLGGSAASWMLDKLGPAMIAGDVSAGFSDRSAAQGPPPGAGAGAGAERAAARHRARHQPICRCARPRRRQQRQPGAVPRLRPHDQPDHRLTLIR